MDTVVDLSTVTDLREDIEMAKQELECGYLDPGETFELKKQIKRMEKRLSELLSELQKS